MSTEIDPLGAWTPPEEDENKIDDKELWNLDVTLTEFILPRLKAFKEMKRLGFPELSKDGVVADEQTGFIAWEQNLDDIIAAFEIHRQGEWVGEKKQEAMQHGFKLFGEHYTKLWD